VTDTIDGKSFDWTFADVNGTVPKIALERTRSDNARICHHVLRAASSVVVDVSTCSPEGGTGEAGKIAEQISTRVPQ
jgi:hypothetical protein